MGTRRSCPSAQWPGLDPKRQAWQLDAHAEVLDGYARNSDACARVLNSRAQVPGSQVITTIY